MVEKFREILRKIVEKKGQVTLFAILKMDDLIDRWTVVLSAPWSTEDTRKEDFELIKTLIIEILNEEERATVARIGIFQKEEQIIRALSQYKQGSLITDTVKINGSVVHEAYILYSESEEVRNDDLKTA